MSLNPVRESTESTWSTCWESSLNPQATFFDTHGAPYVLSFPRTWRGDMSVHPTSQMCADSIQVTLQPGVPCSVIQNFLILTYRLKKKSKQKKKKKNFHQSKRPPHLFLLSQCLSEALVAKAGMSGMFVFRSTSQVLSFYGLLF